MQVLFIQTVHFILKYIIINYFIISDKLNPFAIGSTGRSRSLK